MAAVASMRAAIYLLLLWQRRPNKLPRSPTKSLEMGVQPSSAMTAGPGAFLLIPRGMRAALRWARSNNAIAVGGGKHTLAPYWIARLT